MALFIIERSFAEQVEIDAHGLEDLERYNHDHQLRWLFSFLSADKRKTYCLYEAADAEALYRQARDLGMPADVIIPVSEINPDMFSGVSVSGHLAR